MPRRMQKFLFAEDGAITTDWVVLVGGVLIATVMASTAFGPNLQVLMDETMEKVVEVRDLFPD